MLKHNNKGLSYLELVVAITIGVLLTTFFTISLTTIHRNNANRAKDKIEVSVKTARNNALSKGGANGYVNFLYKDHKVYCYIGKKLDTGTNKASLTNPNQKWELIATNVSDFEFDTVNLLDGMWASMNFKQATGELIGWSIFTSSTETTTTLTESDTHKLRILTEINEKSVSEVTIDKFGTVK